MLSEPLFVVARLALAFDNLAIGCLVGGSLASFDAVGVLKVQGDLLDRQYLEYWAHRLDVWELLALAVKREPESGDRA